MRSPGASAYIADGGALALHGGVATIVDHVLNPCGLGRQHVLHSVSRRRLVSLGAAAPRARGAVSSAERRWGSEERMWSTYRRIR